MPRGRSNNWKPYIITHPDSSVRLVDYDRSLSLTAVDQAEYYCLYDNHIFSQSLSHHARSVSQGLCGCKECGTRHASSKIHEYWQSFIDLESLRPLLYDHLSDNGKIKFDSKNFTYDTESDLEFVCTKCGSLYSRGLGNIIHSNGEWYSDSIKRFYCRDCSHKDNLEKLNSSYTSIKRARAYLKLCDKGKLRSTGEIQLEDYIKSLGYDVVHIDAGDITSKSWDIYVPKLQIVFEYDGCGHREVFDTKEDYYRARSNQDVRYCTYKGYHKQKDDEALSLGVRIVHITDRFWSNKSTHSKAMKVVYDVLHGCYEGPYIDLKDPTYGDIKY